MSYSFTDYPSSGPEQGVVQDLTPAADPGSVADAITGSLKRLYDGKLGRIHNLADLDDADAARENLDVYDRSTVDAELLDKADATDAVLSGSPTAPTPLAGDSTTRLATTAFVAAAIAALPPPDLTPYATTASVNAGLAGKANASHMHAIGEVNGLQLALDAKLATDGNGGGLIGLTKAQVGLASVPNLDTTAAVNAVAAAASTTSTPDTLVKRSGAGAITLGSNYGNQIGVAASSTALTVGSQYGQATISGLGVITAPQISTTNGSGILAINASNISSGTLDAARLPTLPYLSINNPTFTGALSGPAIATNGLTVAGNVSITGAYQTTANQLAFSFSGDQNGGGTFLLRNRSGQNGIVASNSAGVAEAVYSFTFQTTGGNVTLFTETRGEYSQGAAGTQTAYGHIGASGQPYLSIDKVTVAPRFAASDSLVGCRPISNGQRRNSTYIVPDMADSTAAAWRGRTVHSVASYLGAHEVVRHEADTGGRGYAINMVQTTAPTDSMLINGSFAFSSDASGNLKIKQKDAGGVVSTANAANYTATRMYSNFAGTGATAPALSFVIPKGRYASGDLIRVYIYTGLGSAAATIQTRINGGSWGGNLGLEGGTRRVELVYAQSVAANPNQIICMSYRMHGGGGSPDTAQTGIDLASGFTAADITLDIGLNVASGSNVTIRYSTLEIVKAAT